MVSAAAGFAPRFPWLGPDLQTLRNVLVGPRAAAPPARAERLELPMRDGDRLLAALDRPPNGATRPTAVLVHGLTGCAESVYMLDAAAALLAAGHAVVRLNLRGAGAGRALARGHYHAGRSADLADALAALPAGLARDGVVAAGFSLGGNMLLKHLGEAGRATPVRAAASVSAPIDLAATWARLLAPRNAGYHAYLLRRMKAEATAAGTALSEGERAAIAGARSVLEYDDRFVAPRHGFAGAADYYGKSSSSRFLVTVAAPTLVIHARDDPWIPAAAYDAVDWRSHPKLTPLLPARGGHVGFHGRGDAVPWHVRRIVEFFAACA